MVETEELLGVDDLLRVAERVGAQSGDLVTQLVVDQVDGDADEHLHDPAVTDAAREWSGPRVARGSGATSVTGAFAVTLGHGVLRRTMNVAIARDTILPSASVTVDSV